MSRSDLRRLALRTPPASRVRSLCGCIASVSVRLAHGAAGCSPEAVDRRRRRRSCSTCATSGNAARRWRTVSADRERLLERRARRQLDADVVKPLSPAGAKPVGQQRNQRRSRATKITVADTERLPAVARGTSAPSRRYQSFSGRLSSACGCGFRKYAAIIGVSVRATSSENSTAHVTVKPNGRKNSPAMPLMNATGMNTAHSVSGSRPPRGRSRCAASSPPASGVLPMRKCRTMFSTSTIASSTRMPTTSDSASIVSMFSV